MDLGSGRVFSTLTNKLLKNSITFQIVKQMKNINITIDYTPAIDEIINQLAECGNFAKKVSYNTIEIDIDGMSPKELVLMGMMIKSCERSLILQ